MPASRFPYLSDITVYVIWIVTFDLIGLQRYLNKHMIYELFVIATHKSSVTLYVSRLSSDCM